MATETRTLAEIKKLVDREGSGVKAYFAFVLDNLPKSTEDKIKVPDTDAFLKAVGDLQLMYNNGLKGHDTEINSYINDNILKKNMLDAGDCDTADKVAITDRFKKFEDEAVKEPIQNKANLGGPAMQQARTMQLADLYVAMSYDSKGEKLASMATLPASVDKDEQARMNALAFRAGILTDEIGLARGADASAIEADALANAITIIGFRDKFLTRKDSKNYHTDGTDFSNLTAKDTTILAFDGATMKQGTVYIARAIEAELKTNGIKDIDVTGLKITDKLNAIFPKELQVDVYIKNADIGNLAASYASILKKNKTLSSNSSVDSADADRLLLESIAGEAFYPRTKVVMEGIGKTHSNYATKAEREGAGGGSKTKDGKGVTVGMDVTAAVGGIAGLGLLTNAKDTETGKWNVFKVVTGVALCALGLGTAIAAHRGTGSFAERYKTGLAFGSKGPAIG